MIAYDCCKGLVTSLLLVTFSLYFAGASSRTFTPKTHFLYSSTKQDISHASSTLLRQIILIHRGGSNPSNDVNDFVSAEAAWQSIKTATMDQDNTIALDNVQVPKECDDLNQFFDLFLSNDAPHSIASFMRDRIGDSELNTSQWLPSNDSAEKGGFQPNVMTRTISYRHPVRAPMAPPSALATKRQTLRRFGDYGFVLDTVTQVNGVPKTDCFVVNDRILVEVRFSNTGERLTVNARFGLHFVKKTMFKSIITRTTTAEFKNWFDTFGLMVTGKIHESHVGEMENDTMKQDGKPAVQAAASNRAVLPPPKLVAPKSNQQKRSNSNRLEAKKRKPITERYPVLALILMAAAIVVNYAPI